jgi:hypothetical protein
MNSAQLGRKREDSKPVILGDSFLSPFANAAFGGDNLRTEAPEVGFI